MNKEQSPNPSIPVELKAKIEAQLDEDGAFDRGVVWALLQGPLLQRIFENAAHGWHDFHFEPHALANEAFLKFRAKNTPHTSAESMIGEVRRIACDVVVDLQRRLGAEKRGGGRSHLSYQDDPEHELENNRLFLNSDHVKARRELKKIRDRVSEKGWSQADETAFTEYLFAGEDDAYGFMVTMLAWDDVARVAAWFAPKLWARHGAASYAPDTGGFEHLTQDRCGEIFASLIRNRHLNAASFKGVDDFLDQAYRRMRVALIAAWETRDRSAEQRYTVEAMTARLAEYRRALNRLSQEIPESHQVVILRWEAGYSYKELSQELNLSTSKVRTAYERGVKRIAVYLGFDQKAFLTLFTQDYKKKEVT